MEIVLNDYSIDAQFKSIDEFVDSLVDNTLPVLNMLKKNKITMLKSYNTWSRHVTSADIMHDFVFSQKYNGYAEIQKLRSLLCELQDEPYWQDSLKTQKESTYSCDVIGNFSGEQPNCFSEAFERDKMLFSLEHNAFDKDVIMVTKDQENMEIHNAYDRKSIGKIMFGKGCIGFSELLLGGTKKVEFYSNNSRYYADEVFEDGKISKDDALAVKKDFDMLIEGRDNGYVLSRLTDSINYRNITYCEFRTSLSGRREFRIFYIIDGDKWVFFDALIKKTQETPDSAKRRTYSLIKQYKEDRKS